MADVKFDEIPEVTDPQDDDILPMDEDSSGNTSFIKYKNLMKMAGKVNLLGNSGFGVWSNSDTNKGLSRGTPAENVSVNSGSTLPVVGETLTGDTSTAVGRVISITDTNAGWGGVNGEATLSLGACTGRFQDNETLTGSAAGANCCTLNMPPTAAGVDLVRNGSFTADEDPPQGWTASNATLSTEAGGDVGNCMKVLDGGAGNGYAHQSITTVVGKIYTFSCYAKDIDTGQNGLIEVGTAAGDATYYSSGTITDDAGDTYTVTFEATTTTTVISLNCTSNGGAYYFDSVILYEITPCCTAADTKGPESWRKESTLHVYRQHNDGGTYTKDGAFYSLKCVPTAAGGYLHWPLFAIRGEEVYYQKFAGKVVAFGAWAKTSTASHARLALNDGTGAVISNYHSGGGSWERLEVTTTVSAALTFFSTHLQCVQNSGIVYFSQPMLVFGSSIGEGNYQQMPGEVIRFEKDIILTDYDLGVGDILTDIDAELNIEAQSQAKIPKGIAELYLNIRAMDSAVAATIGVWMGPDTTYCANGIGDVGLELEGLGNDKKGQAAGWVRCDSGGDPWLFINESGAGQLDCEIRVQGVRLR